MRLHVVGSPIMPTLPVGGRTSIQRHNRGRSGIQGRRRNDVLTYTAVVQKQCSVYTRYKTQSRDLADITRGRQNGHTDSQPRKHRDTKQARYDVFDYTDAIQTQCAVTRIALPTLPDDKGTGTQRCNRGRTGTQGRPTRDPETIRGCPYCKPQ